MYNFIINDTLLKDSPVDWTEPKETTFKINLHGDGYGLLRALYEEKGWLNKYKIRVEKRIIDNSPDIVFEGELRLWETKFNVSKGNAECIIYKTNSNV